MHGRAYPLSFSLPSAFICRYEAERAAAEEEKRKKKEAQRAKIEKAKAEGTYMTKAQKEKAAR